MKTQTQLGNYRLLRKLSSGGFATVYLGQHIYLETQAAIKVLRVDSHMASQGREHFLAEARMVARLHHPHIVRILEFGIEQGTPFLVMEYAPHGSLLTRHPSGTILQSDDILPYLQQIAQALQHAHNRQIIHCDVKPENILLNAQDELLLSDFGIAITIQSHLRLHEIVGTMYYMSPEQFRGQPVAASDQYALGVMLYSWLTGRLPFRGQTIKELLIQHTNYAPVRLRRLNPQIHPEIERVILRALAKQPGQRFPSVAKFAQAFEQASLKKTGPAHSSAHLNQALPAEPSQPIRLLPSLASFLSAAEPKEAAVPAQPTDTHSQKLEDPEGTHPVTQTDFEDAPDIFTSPQRTKEILEATLPRTFFQPKEPHQGEEMSVYTPPVLNGPTLNARTDLLPASLDLTPPKTRFLPETFLRQLTYDQHNAWVSSVAWSPDGTLIASSAWDNSIHVWSAARGKPTYIYEGHSQPVKSVVWSPDGSYLASGGWDNLVHIWEPQTGANLANGFCHEAQIETVAWSPNGIYIASAGHDGVVFVWKAANGRLICRYTGHQGPIWSLAWSPEGSALASAGYDKTVQVWHFPTCEHIYTFSRHKEQVTSVAWSPDTCLLASGDREGMVYLWNLQKKQVSLHYHDPLGTVKTLAWSPNGRYLASAVKSAQIWDSACARPIYPELTYEGHSRWINTLAWSPDGTRLASGSDDCTVQIWYAHLECSIERLGADSL